ncbi:jg7245 [Pararge aegeria aegeria]|uniref:Lipase n=2 Tax=Pararge aegeria TaxID=116150 RepID=A0A8S4SC69_9NEOP|nr:jg7245 [Pararge aegeria aegeria]
MNIVLILILIISSKTHVLARENIADELNSLLQRSVDGPLNFPELARNYGYQTEKYDVQTEDGYLLGLFRIPGERGLPTLLMHGLMDTSDTWLIRGNTSLGVTLACEGYDLWFGNIRGNRYSRRHVKLNPDIDTSFWDYSFHEHGFYDLPAIIDTILWKTGSKKLNAIGHSQGNTIFYILGSTRPEYNAKVNVMTALAPVCFFNNAPPPLSWLIQISPQLYELAMSSGVHEIFGNVTPIGKATKLFCSRPSIGYAVCLLGVLFPFVGFDTQELLPPFFNVIVEHNPAGTTTKNFYHFFQLGLRGRFSNFDYGPDRNLLEYNSKTPPDYNLTSVTMPIVFIAARNDKLSRIPDVENLLQQLPNVVRYTIIKRRIMNHLDYVWGAHMKAYLFPYILEVLEKFN